jgi:hypothetical protein
MRKHGIVSRQRVPFRYGNIRNVVDYFEGGIRHAAIVVATHGECAGSGADPYNFKGI